MDFGERLAFLRQGLTLTQDQLAARVGVHPSQLHRYEAGTAQPTLDVVRRLSIALSVSTDELVFGDAPPRAANERLERAFQATVNLDERERDVVAELIEAFVAAHVDRSRPRGRRGRPPRTR